MCGIAGIVSRNKTTIQVQRLKAMTDAIAHRGPDGEGQWINSEGHVGLGHRRLSIIDLSHAGGQPMHCLERYSIVFNGEIYNYIEIRERLLKKGYRFQSATDTEVLLALYHDKKEACLDDLDGMFSFAIWDEKEQVLFCARDRFGEKPFFYSYKEGEHFFFGSEMKALWAGGVPKEVNPEMVFNFLEFDLLENPQDLSETFYRHCYKLPHGHYLKLDAKKLSLSIHPYFDIDWRTQRNDISLKEAEQTFAQLFQTSVARRLRSDVPVGSSLSGGLDSSLIVCVIDELKKGRAQKQNTFSARFPGFQKDEGSYMQMVVDKTNVEAYYTYPSNDDFLDHLDHLLYHQEEPFGSASIYAQYCVMKLAKEKKVTVLLDGQGADEILAGYHHYFRPFFRGLRLANKGEYDREITNYQKLHNGNAVNGLVSEDLPTRFKSSFPEAFLRIRRAKNDLVQIVSPEFNSSFYRTNRSEEFRYLAPPQNLNQSLYYSTMKYGLQQLLRYADRNSMAHSREVRLPFLNHELVEFLFSLPPSFKISQGWTKWLMRLTYQHLLPEPIVWRKDKIGYEPPQKAWMENPVFKEKVVHARENLVQSGILSKKVLSRQPKAEAASSRVDNSWNHLMAGALFTK